MSNLETAIRVAAIAHTGQIDKGGAPYITHPLRLMNAVDSEEAKVTAVLHDVVEDTDVTIDQLRQYGFSENILAAVECVTHSRDEAYADYVVRCNRNAVARQVKRADLADNTRLERCILRVERVDRDFARIHRYMLSYKFLMDELSESDYRSLMTQYGDLQ